jgi:maltooligosyltrehalose trehalohydrolase
VDFDEAARWIVLHRPSLAVAVNLAEHAATVPLRRRPADVVLSWDDASLAGDAVKLGPEDFAVVTLAGS